LVAKAARSDEGAQVALIGLDHRAAGGEILDNLERVEVELIDREVGCDGDIESSDEGGNVGCGRAPVKNTHPREIRSVGSLAQPGLQRTAADMNEDGMFSA
jgi:hypothetical protein